MKEDEKRARSASKIKQINGLLDALQIQIHAKQKLSRDGFLEPAVVFIDLEQYPAEPEQEPASRMSDILPGVATSDPDHV